MQRNMKKIQLLIIPVDEWMFTWSVSLISLQTTYIKHQINTVFCQTFPTDNHKPIRPAAVHFSLFLKPNTAICILLCLVTIDNQMWIILTVSTAKKIKIEIKIKQTYYKTNSNHVNGKIAQLKQQISELGFLVVLHFDIYRQCAYK